MNQDLTTGKPLPLLWKFCLPLFGSILFQQLYNMADSFVAGRWIGENALAAVGNSYEITLIFIAFAFGCNMGCSIVVSKFFGGKAFEKTKTCISTTYLTSALLCLFLMIIGIYGSDLLLEVIQTPKNIFADSKLYLSIYIYGLPFLFFYNIATGIFTALGDSKTPFYLLAMSSSANIFVDILFVSTFQMGVAGVAWATFLCQGISCIIANIVLLKRILKMPGHTYPFFSKKILFEIITIAIPSILQQSFISIGNIIIQGVINGFGASVIAGYAASIKCNNLVITSFTTIGNGISNYTAQNIGAKKMDRIQEGFKAGIKIIWTLCIPIVLLYFFASSTCIHFFMNNPSQIAIQSGQQFLNIVSFFYFVISIKLICDGILRGAGCMKPFMISTFLDLFLRVVLSILLSKILGSIGIWLSWPIGWSISTLLSFYFYKQKLWEVL